MTDSRPIKPANRLDLDYAAEAARMPVPAPVIDVHTHVNDRRAAEAYARAASLYGIELTYSMTPFDRIDEVRDALGTRVRFIAVPDFESKDFAHAFSDGYLERIAALHARGERMVKFWSAPRGRDLGAERGFPDAFSLAAPHNRRAMQLAADLGMAIMVHVGDPDTWFATKYADAAHYGTKAEQYPALRRALDDVDAPFIAAHMGGWPEDLDFLSSLLERHPNLYLDTSATKWMVRELSKHPRDAFVAFMARWDGRVLFGSDVVADRGHFKYHDAQGVFDLYASRYWALRTLLESDYHGESPIADPDLALIDPEHYAETDAPPLRGMHLPPNLLQSVYSGAATALLDPLYP